VGKSKENLLLLPDTHTPVIYRMKITRHPFCVGKGKPQWPTFFYIEKHVDLMIQREQGTILTVMELANFDVWN
jgi:hypothetical protein